MDELEAAWAALPDSVAGESAPPGTTLAARIRALTAERDNARRGWERCHRRHRASEQQDED